MPIKSIMLEGFIIVLFCGKLQLENVHTVEWKTLAVENSQNEQLAKNTLANGHNTLKQWRMLKSELQNEFP